MALPHMLQHGSTRMQVDDFFKNVFKLSKAYRDDLVVLKVGVGSAWQGSHTAPAGGGSLEGASMLRLYSSHDRLIPPFESAQRCLGTEFWFAKNLQPPVLWPRLHSVAM